MLARMLLAQHCPAQALALLDRMRAAEAAQGRIGSIIEIQALRALALAAGGEDASAVDTLAQTFGLACPEDYLRVFADEGAPMAALLSQLVAAQRAQQAAARVSLGCLTRLLRAFGGEDTAPRLGQSTTAVVPGLVEPLTAREMEVLRLLAAGTPNQAIAEELVVALDTAKTTSGTSSASSARPTAPRPSPGHASSA